MKILSHRMSKIKPSPTLAISARADELKSQGQDIIGLGVGEPDFDTPDHIKEAAIKAIRDGKTKYTAVGGTKELKQAIVAKFERENGLQYTNKQVIASTGGKFVIYCAMMASLNPGDRVIIPAPFWVSYPDMVSLAEGTPVIMRCSQDNNFKIKPENLDAMITKDTKWLILNSPSNPTGMAYTREELEKVGEVLLKHPQVHILCDDIYEHLIYDGFKFHTLAQVVPELKNRILIVNGVSKAYSMTGWRIGYAAGPEELISAMETIQSQSTSNPTSIAQAAAVAALNGPMDFLHDWKTTFVKRRDGAIEILTQSPNITCLKPEGAFYLYPGISEAIGKVTTDGHVINSDRDYASYLIDSVGVAVVPGEAFGGSPNFRISYALGEDKLFEACRRIVKATDMLR